MFKYLPHRTFSPEAFWLFHQATHLQIRTNHHYNQWFAKELLFAIPQTKFELVNELLICVK